MSQFRHLFPRDTATTNRYIYPRSVGSSQFNVPPRDRSLHSSSLIDQLKSAKQQQANQTDGLQGSAPPKGIVIEFQSDPSFKLQLKSLESERSGIELRNSRVDACGVMHATVFIPEGKLNFFLRKFEDYADPTRDTRAGKPRNNDLVASIGQLKLAVLGSFWTDRRELPTDYAQMEWWEVWLRTGTDEEDVVARFRQLARAADVLVSERALRFPDRRVILARCNFNQLLAIENLFDILAELRFAKYLATDFVELPPRDQVEFIEAALSRISPPALDAPSVCHLDTGVNRGHPLLELALASEHLLSVQPGWSTSDGHPHQHGTSMAGLALYGCLTEVLGSPNRIALGHRLESVKIVPDRGAHEPELYGDVTIQSVARMEIAAMRKQRAFALTVTADCRDEGYPSSWSAALDQICSGAEEDHTPTRLIFVSAGNTPRSGRHEYPNHNHLQGVEDPAQSWNVIAVGAYTERTTIRSEEFAGWSPIANAGQLSPASRTSMIWQDRSWPIKPDIVMEGGNLARDPSTGEADYVDDLMLLTTRTGPTGGLLTTTGDTSAATALAARYAAIIWSHYPDLSPESVRGLLIHSARWTPPMLSEFPPSERHNRMRVYGYGVPQLDRALWSARNNATQVIEDSLQPFDQFTDGGQRQIKTKDMRLHKLPWPKSVLEQLGSEIVRLRVTLSYFIEPSPGRRGWKLKHRYQSHGLRFDIKRPTDTSDTEFLRRITKASQNEDDGSDSSAADERTWTIGPKLRCKGSIHSDVWTGTAAQLASAESIAVFPVTGWWKERPGLEGWTRPARYSLIISLETDATEVDLYTPIASQIGVAVSTEVNTLGR